MVNPDKINKNQYNSSNINQNYSSSLLSHLENQKIRINKTKTGALYHWKRQYAHPNLPSDYVHTVQYT